MPQTEDMKRLRLKRKIVGYEWKHTDGFGNILTRQAPSMDLFTDYSMPGIIHDSFEQGIKVDGEWWFEGDILRHEKLTFNVTLTYGAFNKDDIDYYGFFVTFDSGEIADIYKYSNYKRIGNIHEEK